ncbi:hypothetical protein ES695_12320 [Candidatus Atribacteria bacterium 1244-E10-H5-B2]|nr:MAG: hypothetical protein ES695_12320 [Candidatus Atribacteria bacterium 1244-E10-H5-B2]
MGNEIELSENELLEAIKEAGIDKPFQAYIKNKLQVEGDKRVDQGIKSYQKNQNEKNLSDKERIESLETELKEMKNGKAKEDKKTLVKAELKKQDLSEGFLKYIKIDDLDDQSKIAEAVTGFKDDLLNAKQAENDQKLKGGTVPAKGETGNGGDSTIEQYAKSKNAGEVSGNPFQGKLDEGKSENEKGE